MFFERDLVFRHAVRGPTSLDFGRKIESWFLNVAPPATKDHTNDDTGQPPPGFLMSPLKKHPSIKYKEHDFSSFCSSPRCLPSGHMAFYMSNLSWIERR